MPVVKEKQQAFIFYGETKMFKTSKTSGTLTRRCETKIIDAQGKVTETVAFKVDFQIDSKEKHDELVAELGSEVYVTDDEVKELLKNHIIGWQGLKGENGEAIAFTPDALAALLDIPQYLAAVFLGFTEALTGREASRRKN